MTIQLDDELKRTAIENMVKNLAVLRTMLNLSQAELASLIGLGRQTFVAIENRKRNMTWSVFLSLMFVFSQHPQTRALLDLFDIYTPEMKKLYCDAPA